jgi:hypothetical protein
MYMLYISPKQFDPTAMYGLAQQIVLLLSNCIISTGGHLSRRCISIPSQFQSLNSCCMMFNRVEILGTFGSAHHMNHLTKKLMIMNKKSAIRRLRTWL